jgi:hypothetical protein
VAHRPGRMSGSALLHTISFMAVVVGILLTAWFVLVLESAGESRQFFGDDLDAER